MNIYKVTLLAEYARLGMQRLSELPFNFDDLNLLLDQQVEEYCAEVITTYDTLFRGLRIVPPTLPFENRRVALQHTWDGQVLSKVIVDLDVHNYIISEINSFTAGDISQRFIKPLQLIYRNESSQLCNITGICVVKPVDRTVQSYLFEFKTQIDLVNFNMARYKYLDDMLLNFRSKRVINTRELCSLHNINYNQFQRDCKIYYGTTFYDFRMKMKMIAVVEDLMFTKLSLKEIVFRNGFTDYSNMYKVFPKRYKFCLHKVMRLANNLIFSTIYPLFVTIYPLFVTIYQVFFTIYPLFLIYIFQLCSIK